MGFVNYIIELLRDPRAFIASMIATGSLAAYGFVFLIVFIETGVVFFPFLPGDSLLFAAGFFAHNGGFNIVLLLVITWAAAILGDQMNFMIGHFFGQKIIASGKVKALLQSILRRPRSFWTSMVIWQFSWGASSPLFAHSFLLLRVWAVCTGATLVSTTS